jgi:hypothetical protein
MNEDPSFDEVPQFSNQPQNSTMAIVSLVTGILGWTFMPVLGSIVAVVTGHMAKREIRESAGQLEGDGFATAGLILGYSSLAVGFLAICVILIAILFFAVAAVETSSMLQLFNYI